MPYGISVDVSEWERQLLQRAEELVDEYHATKRAPRFAQKAPPVGPGDDDDDAVPRPMPETKSSKSRARKK